MIAPPHPYPKSLRLFAWLTVVATLGLIGLGGLVTSHGAGMAVPDWPTTYGYNMFLFPVSQWVGGILYEHTHRLWASMVGLLTVILAAWVQWRGRDASLKRWCWFAVALVILQGVLGGLRVSLMRDQIGVFHASLAQAFFALLLVIAVVLSPGWSRWKSEAPATSRSVMRWVLLAVGLIYLQLMLGATMRHQHAGLAIPDFPFAYGKLWPPTDEAFLQGVNAGRIDTRDFHPITTFHIHLHMAHRLLGISIAVVVCIAGFRMLGAFGRKRFVGRLALGWMALILVQVGMGAWTVWSNKAADIATLHVVVGALSLVTGVWSATLCRAAVRRGEVKWTLQGLSDTCDGTGPGRTGPRVLTA